MRNFFLLLALSVQFLAAAPTFIPPQGTSGEIIALINAYRAENGLPALIENPILGQIAQGQADYLISQPMGTVGDVHAGPGGSRPKDRAYSAGYGGGGGISVSEIVKGGVDETSDSAIAWWKTSPPHNNTMLSPYYTEIGGGAATDGNGRWWYVANLGNQSGGAYVPSDSSSGAIATAAPVMIPVTVADPRPDGSIVHIVRTGQTLWTIAAKYGVPLAQLFELNGNNETIYIGDEVIVAPAGSFPTLTPTVDPNATAELTATPSPATTATLRPTEQLQQLADVQTTPTVQFSESNLSAEEKARAANSTVYLVVGIALVSIVAVFAASFFIQKPRHPEPPANDPFAPIE
ncbi:MAG: CAP domain-containing protein [Chloroflexi bacterium]|nr:CAP domain-containing protein [Chloroflexota bacterium]